MADQKQVLDVKVSKGITAAQSNEHLRDRSERAEKYAMDKGNYDPTRKHLNFEIAPGGKVLHCPRRPAKNPAQVEIR